MWRAFERKIAWRYLKPRRGEGFLSVIAGFSFLGIGLGVAALIIVMAVMNGFRHELLDRILGFNGHLEVYEVTGQGMKHYDNFQDRLKAFPGVRAIIPQISAQAMVTHQNNAIGAQVRGWTREDLENNLLLSNSMKAGGFPDRFQASSAIIGKRMAERLGVLIGDKITLIAPEGNRTAFGIVPRMRSFEVVDVFEVGMSDIDGNVVFLPLAEAQRFFRLDKRVTSLEVFLDDPNIAPALEKTISNTLPDFVRAVDWKRTNSQVSNALEVERNVMFIILTLIVIVAAFNIVASLVMLVKNKTKDIAILRTIGATRWAIQRVFMTIGLTIGLGGTAFGVALGLGFSLNIESIRQWLESFSGTELFSAEIYFLSQLPARIEWSEVGLVVGMALILSFLATLYPAFRAARLKPAEALRYE